MKWGRLLDLLVLIVLGLGAAPEAAAIDVGWMQQGVRVWYFGGVATGLSSDAEEAYLFKAIAGTSAQVTHHSALNHWTSPQPTDTHTYSLVDQGPVWIHPQVLQTIDVGDHWMGQEITFVIRSTYTWATFPHNLLPSNALFDLQPQRQIVKLTYMIAQSSIGNAYFDSETGILLYYDNVGGGAEKFFVLAEINYDFGQHIAFAEDDGPHAGFHSWVNEASQGNGIVGGGVVDIHSQVESRYGQDVEMWVITNLTGPTGFKPQAYENYAFFGGVPVVKRIAHDQAGSVRPEQWTPYGQYLWWWLPPIATGAVAADARDAPDAVSTIDVFDVAMNKTGDYPLTYAYTGAEIPQRFFFSSLQFGNGGYVTAFSAKDTTIGLDVKPTDFNFWNQTVTDGPTYFRKSMTDDNFPPGAQIPAGWITTPGADAGWLVASDSSYEGPMSLKSADIGDNQMAGIEVSGTYQDGNVSFAARVSSEQERDYFVFYVDGEGQIGGAGNIDWTMVSIPVEAGTHTFTWLYFKNGSVSSGSDAAWIDSVALPPTGVSAPTATTNATSDITAGGATLNGTVSSNGASTTVTFEYGPTTSYGHSATAAQSPLAAGASNVQVSVAVTGLASNARYHYRVVATNSAGTTHGADMTFTTTPSTNANLAGLVLSAGTLLPPFASDTLSYTANVVSNSNAITVTPTAADATATVRVNGVTVASGSASEPITLSVGSNSITILVTAQDGATTKTYTVSAVYQFLAATLDVDASVTATEYDALTDGLIILRYLFGLTGTPLTNGAAGPTATRTDPGAIKAYLDDMRPALDVDGNGTADALTDGLLVIRYLFGRRGPALIVGAIDPLATRTTAADIEAYLQTLMP